jgi:hypothetical protein
MPAKSMKSNNTGVGRRFWKAVTEGLFGTWAFLILGKKSYGVPIGKGESRANFLDILPGFES